jgi:hypothetical protein
MAGTTRLELATSAVTGQRSNQLNYVPARDNELQFDPGSHYFSGEITRQEFVEINITRLRFRSYPDYPF